MTSYAVSFGPTILDHGSTVAEAPAWLGDFEENFGREYTVTDAMAASGDYFITLATRLDKMAQGLPQDSAEQIELEHIVQTLFYLQDHWGLVAKYKQR